MTEINTSWRIHEQKEDDAVSVMKAYEELLASLGGPVDFWDRPGGDWGQSLAQEVAGDDKELEAREDANTAYLLGSKALREDALETAQEWFAVACRQRHPGAAFRGVAALLRAHRVWVVTPAGSGKAKVLIRLALQRLRTAAEWGHGDARYLVTLHGEAGEDRCQCCPRVHYTKSLPLPSVQGVTDCPAERGDTNDEAEPYSPQDSEFYGEIWDTLTALLSPRQEPEDARTPYLRSTGNACATRAADVHHRILGVSGGEEPIITSRQPPELTSPLHLVKHALLVIETISRRADGVTDTQIAQDTGLPVGQLAHMLSMLRREGYVEQLTDGAHVVGESLRMLSSGRHRVLRDKLQLSLDELRDSVGAAVYISRYIDGEVKILHYADGPLASKVNEWGEFHRTAHASAVGECLLAQLDHDGRKDHLSRHKTARLTSPTITNACTTNSGSSRGAGREAAKSTPSRQPGHQADR